MIRFIRGKSIVVFHCSACLLQDFCNLLYRLINLQICYLQVIFSCIHAGNTSSTLMLVAIASTVILGFLFGSLIFILSMWRLRQYSRPVCKSSNTTQGDGSSSNLEMNSNSSSPQVTSVNMNAAYGCDRNTSILLPCNHGQTSMENEAIYETISDLSRSSTMDASVVGLPMTYLLESEIQAPNLNLVPRIRRVCESSDTVSHSEYLEVLASNSTCVTTVNELADENTIEPAN